MKRHRALRIRHILFSVLIMTVFAVVPALSAASLLRPIERVDTHEKVVALTFDDGPHPVMTPKVLQILKHYKVKATFFMIGKQVKSFPELAQSVVKAGHEIGSHTIYHRNPKRCTNAQLEQEIGGSIKIIEAYTGVTPRYYRPPYGRYDQRILAMAERYGLQTILWDADAYDYNPRQSSRNITYYIVKKARPGSIILLHEKRENTVRALGPLIQTLRKDGYHFISLHDLLSLQSNVVKKAQ